MFDLKTPGFWLRWTVTAAVLSLLTACGGYATIKQAKKDESYTKTIDSLLVVVDLSHLKKALVESKWTPHSSSGMTKPTIMDVDKALKEKLLQEFKNQGLHVAVETVDVSTNPQAIRMASIRNPQRQVLLANVSSFVTSTTTHTHRYVSVGTTYNGWTGETTWKMQLYDRDRTAETRAASVWSAEVGSNFGPSRCHEDKYLICAERFASGIVQQLKADKLLKS